MALIGRKARWSVTNAGTGGLPGVGLVLPHVALLLLNLVAIAVGVRGLEYRTTNLPASLFAIVWATLYVALLARVIAEAVSEPRNIKARLERRKAGALLARALPWPERVHDLDDSVDLAVERGTPVVAALQTTKS